MVAPVLGSIGVELDLLIRQGATFGPHEVTVAYSDGTPVDLTGVTLRGSIRKEPKSLTSLPLQFEILDPLAGRYKMWLTNVETISLTAGPTLTHPDSKYVWDSEMVAADGSITPGYYGKVNVFREITHD